MAKIDFQYADGSGQTILRAEAEHFGGGRNAFGPFLWFHLQWPYDVSLAKHRPLSVQGALLWAEEQDGLPIPLQAVLPNAAVAVPISDNQLVQLEERRSGGEPQFSIRLQALALRDDNGAVTTLSHGYMPQRLAVSRDAWISILAQCGFGLRRIVELPPPPSGLGEKWDEANQSLAIASQRLARGHDEEAIAAVRKALERIVEAVGESVGKPRQKSGAFQPYVEEIAKFAAAVPSQRPQNPFPLISELIKATFRWTSGYVHKEAATSQRDEAVSGIALGTAIYGFAARGTFAASATIADP
jgi:hypothetical protein